MILHGSLQCREDHLPRVVAWSILQEPLQRLEGKLVAAVKAVADLSDVDMLTPQRARSFISPTAMGGLAFSGLRRM